MYLSCNQAFNIWTLAVLVILSNNKFFNNFCQTKWNITTPSRRWSYFSFFAVFYLVRLELLPCLQARAFGGSNKGSYFKGEKINDATKKDKLLPKTNVCLIIFCSPICPNLEKYQKKIFTEGIASYKGELWFVLKNLTWVYSITYFEGKTLMKYCGIHLIRRQN